jgi:hypothetical protein
MDRLYKPEYAVGDLVKDSIEWIGLHKYRGCGIVLEITYNEESNQPDVFVLWGTMIEKEYPWAIEKIKDS